VNPNEQRYTAVAIVLHWAIAAAIVSNLIVGWCT
jgi:cytochrome b561